jgi:hypothetical protein
MNHYWGDEDFDWDSLNKAIRFVTDTCRKYGRLGMHSKEKYGTFRDHVYPYDGTLHSLVYPAYVYKQWSKFATYTLDYGIFKRFSDNSGLTWLIIRWQRLVYNYAIQTVCKRYPHLVDELVVMLDHYAWVTPGIFGKTDGTVIHNKHWTKSHE